MLLSLGDSGKGKRVFEEQVFLARARSLTPLRFRVELVPNYAEQPFESDSPVVLTCERRGTTFATGPAHSSPIPRRLSFDDTIILHLLLFRKSQHDDMDMESNEVVLDGEPLKGFDPVMSRLTIRDSTPDGVVNDCTAIDLAKFIVGAHGIVEKEIELQLGSKVSLRVITDLDEGPLDDVSSPSLSGPKLHSLGSLESRTRTGENDEAKKDEETECVSDLSSTQGTDSKIEQPSATGGCDESSIQCTGGVFWGVDDDSSTDENVPDAESAQKLRENSSADLGDEFNSDKGHNPLCVSSSDTSEATEEFISKGVKSMRTDIVRPDVEPCAPLSMGEEMHPPQNESCSSQFDGPSVEMRKQSSSKSSFDPARGDFSSQGDLEVHTSCDAPVMSESVSLSPGSIILDQEEATRARGAPIHHNVANLDDIEGVDFLSSRSETSSESTGGDVDSGWTSSEQDEEPKRCQFGDVRCQTDEASSPNDENRLQLADHPFNGILESQKLGHVYMCTVDEGLWKEQPVVTHVNSPFPISIWSIQGPEEVDMDDEDEMMDLGDGVVGPKRNIAKLQAGAMCSNVKHGVPATPGSMSPLQRTYLRASDTRQAVVFALGRPAKCSRRTALAASKYIEQNVIHVEEPDLSDSECDSSEGEDEIPNQVDPGGGISPRASAFLDVIELAAFKQRSESSSCEVPCHSDSNKSLKIRQRASQVAELMNRINELDAESFSIKQLLKKTKTLAADMKSERDYLKELLSEKEQQGMDGTISGARRAKEYEEKLEELEAERLEYERNSTSLKADLEEARRDTELATEELEAVQAQMTSENTMRAENERLLSLILSLKNELDREPGSPDVLDMLKETRRDLAKQKEESERLREELAQAKAPKKKTPKTRSSNPFARSSKNTGPSPRSVTEFSN